MNLEPTAQSEVSQQEKDKYCILAYTRGIQKDGTDEPILRAAKETQTEKTAGAHSVGRRGYNRSGEQHGDRRITVCKTESQWECAVDQGAQPSAL